MFALKIDTKQNAKGRKMRQNSGVLVDFSLECIALEGGICNILLLILTLYRYKRAYYPKVLSWI